MEFELEKKIKKIKKKARENQAVFTANVSEPHLDADTLSAFAENALPEKSKKLYTAHLADCDRCRRILSNLISLNAEEEIIPVKIAETPIVETVIPWYRKLLFGRKLVYTMGALVAVFSAFTIYIVFQNTGKVLNSEVSQANTSSKARGPSAAEEPVFSSNATSVANTNAAMNTSSVAANSAVINTTNRALNTSATPTSSAANTSGQPLAKSPEPTDRNILDDAPVASGETAPVASAPPPPRPAIKEITRDTEKEVGASKPDAALAKSKNGKGEENKVLAEPRNAEREDLKITRNVPLPSKKLSTKNVGGKTFNYENSVWIDSAYRQGNPIINVSRGTNEYRKLDGGLRNIAEQFSETVVVVWKSKNYRIQ